MSIRAATIRKLTGAMLRKAGKTAPAAGELHVVLLNDRAMIALNADLMHREGTTDVITLAYGGMPGMKEAPPADIYINAECALREGVRRPGGAGRELALYLAHGIDHLLGHDDRTPKERASMRRRELRWLRDPVIEDMIKELTADTRSS